MTSILANVNRSDLIMDSASGGGGGGSVVGGNSSASGSGVTGVTGGVGVGVGIGIDNGTSYSTGTSPAIWLSYNSSGPTSTIENSNASRHFADHPETSGALGIEAVIIVVVVSLIPVSVIACMVFVISFNCLKKRSSLWSTTASPNTVESNTVAMHSQVAYDGGGGAGAGAGRRKSAAHSVLDIENLTNASRFAGENDNEIAMADTPLSLIYPADAFSAYMDTSKSSLTTPISSNSVITMTMRNNHLIVETEERIPCSLLDGQHLYAAGSATADGMARNSANFYVQCQVEEYEPNDDSLFDDADSFCENRYCQHSTCGGGGGGGENGCAFCDDSGGGGGGGAGGVLSHHRDGQDDDDDDDDDYDYDHDHCNRNLANGKDKNANANAFYDAIVAKSARTTTASDSGHVAADEEDQHVEIFHKNIAAVVAIESSQTPNGEGEGEDDTSIVDNKSAARNSNECHLAQQQQVPASSTDVALDDKEGQGRGHGHGHGHGHVHTGYSQSDAHGCSCSRFACSEYAYRNGNQNEYDDVWTKCVRNKRFAASSASAYITSADTCSKLANANANANANSPTDSVQASSTDCLPLSSNANASACASASASGYRNSVDCDKAPPSPSPSPLPLPLLPPPM